ncbi:MAG: hypothetical protein KAS32_11270 [Candidatus Peribacteraceae bacterium]|nr:hypothetical protein [Candidatus Peribacteraceae bacterium]
MRSAGMITRKLVYQHYHKASAWITIQVTLYDYEGRMVVQDMRHQCTHVPLNLYYQSNRRAEYTGEENGIHMYRDTTNQIYRT